MDKIRISQGCTKARVDLLEFPENPYKTVLGQEVWKNSNPPERFKMIRERMRSADDSLNKVSFRFAVSGLPRHQFAQHVRARIGVTFYYENPNPTPDHFVPYTPIYDDMFLGFKAGSEVGGYFEEPATSVTVSKNGSDGSFKLEYDGPFTMITKFGAGVLRQLLEIPNGKWEESRDYLPPCYEQPYQLEIQFKTLVGQCARRLCLGEEAQIVTNHYLQKAAVASRFPLLASVLNPACIRVGKCLYAKSYALSNAFGCLFSGCDYRHPKRTDYASFNKSCSDIGTLKREVQPAGVIEEMDSLKTPESFEELDQRDQEIFQRAN